MARTLKKEREGILNCWGSKATNAILEGAQLGDPVDQAGGEGLQERRVLRDDDLPQAGEAGLLGADVACLCYPLETRKGRKSPYPETSRSGYGHVTQTIEALPPLLASAHQASRQCVRLRRLFVIDALNCLSSRFVLTVRVE